MKIPLKDISFLIPLRIDSIERLENMFMSINYLERNFDTNIFVLQASAYDNGMVTRFMGKQIHYRFVEDFDTVFYRTKYLNQMTMAVDTPYVAIWDTDVVIHKDQIIESVQKLREGYKIAYPYDGHFYDTTQIIREVFRKTGKIQALIRNKAKMGLIYGNKMKGGAMFVNRESYINAGMENENFYGWGPEDFERYDRWEIMGYKIYRCDGCLFHLTHSRTNNSTFRSVDQMKDSNIERTKTMLSSKQEIIKKMTSK